MLVYAKSFCLSTKGQTHWSAPTSLIFNIVDLYIVFIEEGIECWSGDSQ